MFNLQSMIFAKFFTKRDKRDDINKDSDDKGTLERYMEVFGEDVDSQLIPMITELLDRVINPYAADEKYLPYMESYYGYDEKNHTLYMGQDTKMVRAVVKIMPRLLNMRGTIRALRLLFGMLGMTVELDINAQVYGFDSDTTLDSDVRTFDSFLQDYTYFGLKVTAPNITMTDDLMEIIRSIIAFNMPINAKWSYLEFNGTIIGGVMPDFNYDYNIDYAT